VTRLAVRFLVGFMMTVVYIFSTFFTLCVAFCCCLFWYTINVALHNRGTYFFILFVISRHSFLRLFSLYFTDLENN
jgi:hypothetical protein